MIEAQGEQAATALVSETRLHKVGRILRNTAPVLLQAHIVDFDNLRDKAYAARVERAEWVKERMHVLAPFMGRHHLEAFERAELELFCALREQLPARGLPVNALRWQGFKLDVITGNILVSAVFPEGWIMEPLQPADNPVNSTQARLVDPYGEDAFNIFYRSGLNGVNASISPVRN